MQDTCKDRFRAEDVNANLESQLSKFVPKPGMAELFKQVISDISVNDKKGFEEEPKNLVAEISAQNNLLTKIHAMFLSDDIVMRVIPLNLSIKQ